MNLYTAEYWSFTASKLFSVKFYAASINSAQKLCESFLDGYYFVIHDEMKQG